MVTTPIPIGQKTKLVVNARVVVKVHFRIAISVSSSNFHALHFFLLNRLLI